MIRLNHGQYKYKLNPQVFKSQLGTFINNTSSEEVIQTFASHIKGRTFLVTGMNTESLGGNTIRAPAKECLTQLILVSRIKPIVESVLADNSIRKAAALINEEISRIDAIINNAGVMAIRHLTRGKHGNEFNLSSNYIGHFLLTNLIMAKILAAGLGARIINATTSATQYRRKGIVSLAAHPGSVWAPALGLGITMDDLTCIWERLLSSASRRDPHSLTPISIGAFQHFSYNTPSLLSALWSEM
ncbi:retinol dehydrogenase 13 [Biscogniauxia marginata]|nr:retinol dehydrogenase 13 [Biscogniauxia marginata]